MWKPGKERDKVYVWNVDVILIQLLFSVDAKKVDDNILLANYVMQFI